MGGPRLVGFCDSSELAVCAALYVVWTSKEQGTTVELLMGKCRVAPLLGMTIPRGEMQALVILTQVVGGRRRGLPGSLRFGLLLH